MIEIWPHISCIAFKLYAEALYVPSPLMGE